FPAQLPGPPESPLEKPRLEPAVEVLDAPVELRFPLGDKHRLDAEVQAESDDPREPACRWTPARQLAGVVELDLLRQPQILPALSEEPEHLIHAARAGQAEANGTVEDVLAHPDVIAAGALLEVDRPHQIDLMELVGGSGLGAGVLLAWQQRGEADPRRG